MKKVLVILSVAIFALGFTACKKDKAETTPENTDTAAATTDATPAETAPAATTDATPAATTDATPAA
jgi:hypothetical protein